MDFVLLLLLIAKASGFDINEMRPSVTSENGNLMITAGLNKNISFNTNGEKSHINIKGIEIDELIFKIKTFTKTSQKMQSNFRKIDETIPMLHNLLINKTKTTNIINEHNGTFAESQTMAREFIEWRRRFRSLETRVNKLNDVLKNNECSSNPCINGGTCIDDFEKFICLCEASWGGADCSVDIDECELFQNSIHGCQNGGTCTNLPGSFICACPTGWYGLNCHLRSQQCNAGTDSEICGHGTCIQQANGFLCICELGWKTNGVTPECTVDMDECSGNYHPCSAIPFVPCMNTPGSFKCGSCPTGYSGSGFYCVDVDECLENNGGCSTNPSVLCHNTIGSRECGACPPGFEGDGITCKYKGLCEINNGGCNRLAKCTTNSAISSTYVLCTCPSSYTGIGIGAKGCVQSTSNAISFLPIVPPNHCTTTICHNGVCRDTFEGPTCVCDAGYTGSVCDQFINPCEFRPCQNGGTCIRDSTTLGGYRCECTADFSGIMCENQASACRDTKVAMEGNITFPEGNLDNYKHNSRCIWTIETQPNKVLNVTFTRFNLEKSTVHGCVHDWLEIYDGKYTSYHKIGRFCGQQLTNFTVITSTRNVMVVIFKSDSSIAHTGFSLHWNSINPTCGENFESVEQGEIISPGYPGPYPKKRDCIWNIGVKPGNRIEFSFTTLNIGIHSDCNHDYLKIYDGPSDGDTILKDICNSSLPTNVVSSGPNALIHFHSSDTDEHSVLTLGYWGFMFSFSAKPATPGCGGIYTSFKGEISAPMLNGMYHRSVICEYLIVPPAKGRIKLKFLSFELESSIYCKNDFLQIFDGDSSNSPSSPRYCGNSLPGDFYSTSEKVLVHFYSDSTVSGEGFKIQYESICHYLFTADSGILSSPGYPKIQLIERQCTYLIIQPQNYVIILNFLHFDIHQLNRAYCDRFNYLKIHDGDNSSYPLIGIPYCGLYYKPTTIISKYNALYLEYSWDVSVKGTGWQANYTTINLDCGGIINDMSGTLTFPNSKDPEITYGHNMTCEWILSAPAGHVIRLTWLSLNLENKLVGYKECFNFVEVYEYHLITNERQIIRRFCGNVKPPSFLTYTNTLIILFHSNNSIASAGFSFSYAFTDNQKVCGGRHLSNTGVIISPGWPNHPPSNKDCTWTIHVSSRHQIKLNISHLDIEGDCHENFLEIIGGDYSTAPILGKFCNSTPSIMVSPSNFMKIHFHSAFYMRGMGFYATWESVNTGCGGILEGSSGTIISPNYPETYDGETECIWRLHTNPGSIIELTFIDIELDDYSLCIMDYVELYNIINTETNKIGRYCVLRKTPPLIHSESNNVLVKFRSDSFMMKRGFLLSFHSICSPNIVGFSGVIESPNFPKKYPPGMNCTWKIHVPTGNQIKVIFSHFLVEDLVEIQEINEIQFGKNKFSNIVNNCSDFVQIKDGTEQTFSVKNTYCGFNSPPMFTSSDNKTDIRFISDYTEEYDGFRVEWRLFGCGGQLRRPSGDLKTGERLNYIQNKQCDWIINVEEGNSVELVIQRYETENHKSNGQSIVVYNGMSKNTPKVLEFYKTRLRNVTYTSSGNYMFISVFSNNIGLFFVANYKTVPSICGGKLTTPTGMIHSPNYPKNYNLHSSCLWYISVAKDHRVHFTFDEFDLIETTDCLDYVKVYKGHTPINSNLVLTKCGSDKKNEIIVSVSNILLIQFFTNSSTTAKGFTATYKTVCGQIIRTESDGFINPDPSIFYGNNNLGPCEWNIISKDPSDKVALTFTHLDLFNDSPKNNTPCPRQFVEVFSGESASAPMIGRYCGNKIPATIVGRGNALTVILSQITEPGKLFAAYYSVLSTSCGGELTSEEGKFTSPQYPDTYPVNSNCIWKIKPALGNRITLTFVQFNIGTDNCELDFLEIRENDGIGKLLGIYCGDKLPSTITANTGVWIKFHSMDDSTGPGFVAEYALTHGNDFEEIEFGKIASPMYPDRYTGNGNYKWRINLKFEQKARVVIKEIEFSMKNEASCLSYLAIYDGYDEKAPLLLKKCDNTESHQIESTSHIIYIEFNSPSDPDGSLFLLEWNAIIANTDPVSVINSTCGSNITVFISKDQREILQSPGFPNGYGTQLRCIWTFETDLTSHLVLKFKTMSLEEDVACFVDRVSIYSGRKDTQTWDKVGSYCWKNATSQYISSKSNWMKVEFATDALFNQSGFEAEIYPECGGNITEPTGILSSPTFGGKLIGGSYLKECVWKINVKPGRKIKLEILEIDIKQESDICENFIMLRDGISDESPYLGKGKFCSNDAISEPFLTRNNHLFIRYKYAISFRMSMPTFKMRFVEISENCGFEILLDADFNSTIISSPNYPNVPNLYTECTWKIRVPNGERIKFDFIEFDLTADDDCANEYVEIRDGGSENSELIQRFCSSKKPPTQKSMGNMIFIKFLTEITDPGKGFKANVSIDICGGLYDITSGIIKAPTKLQLMYSNSDLECKWQLMVPIAHNVIMNLDMFFPTSVNCENASIVISDLFEFNNTESLLSEKLCGKRKNLNYRSISNVVIVRMTMKKETIKDPYYFQMKYHALKHVCGGEITANRATIQSNPILPNVPFIHECIWKIQVDDGRRIKLKILQGFGSLSSTITFYDNWDISGPLIVTRDTKIVETPSNRMLIYMWIRFAIDYIPFIATYTSEEPSICGKFRLKDEGILLPPKNATTYHCVHEYQIPNNKNDGNTAVFKFYNLNFNGSFRHSNSYCSMSTSHLYVTTEKHHEKFIQICETTNETIIVRSPSPITKLEITKRTNELDFKIEYKLLPCGRIIEVQNVESSTLDLKLPQNFLGKIDCAWKIIFPENDRRATISLNNITLSNRDCTKESYRIISFGASPNLIFRNWCHDESKTLVKVNLEDIVFEYSSEKFYEDTSLKLKIIRDAKFSRCRGQVYKSSDDVIYTPNFPKNYANNEECLWKIVAESGYRIKLIFEKRFAIQQSLNCTKDYIEIQEKENHQWIPIKRFCGRNVPENYSSFSNELQILFRSDASITNDGFQVRWEYFCGGIYWASNQIKILTSPGYPESPKNIDCLYLIKVIEEKYIKIHFEYFDLEDEYDGTCKFDNLTIQPSNDENFGTVHCGRDSPGTKILWEGVKLHYRTNHSFYQSGFKLTYSIDDCGGIINTPKIIELKNNDVVYKCIWNITAPKDKVIYIRFRKFHIPDDYKCNYNHLKFYKGNEMNETMNSYRFCGNLNVQPPTIKSETNYAIMSLRLTFIFESLDIEAEINFIKACGGTLHVNSSNDYELKIPNQYESFLNCEWQVLAPMDYVLRISFTNFSVALCYGINQTATINNNCTCDYLELRDGEGPMSTFMAKYCGLQAPSELVSSKNRMWMKFISDGTGTSSGITAIIKAVPSLCGHSVLQVNGSRQTLHSPKDSDGYVINGIRCSWTLPIVHDSSRVVLVRFYTIDLEPPIDNMCPLNYVDISNAVFNVEKPVEHMQVVFSTYNYVNYMQEDFPDYFRFIYCGNVKNSEFYLYSTEAKITLVTSADVTTKHKGFSMEYQIIGCSENYTTDSGRIYINHLCDTNQTCTNLIKVGENKTISLYFRKVSIFKDESTITIKDGYSPESQTLGIIRSGNYKPLPFYSTTNTLFIQSSLQIYETLFIEATYMSTDAGQGCGGFIRDHRGIIYSPLYPLPYRGKAPCEWTIQTPEESFVRLKFKEFSLGPMADCEVDYLDLRDKDDGQIGRYCSKDKPADFIGKSNHLKIVYHTSNNNGGSGWVIIFDAKHYLGEIRNVPKQKRAKWWRGGL